MEKFEENRHIHSKTPEGINRDELGPLVRNIRLQALLELAEKANERAE